MAKRIQSQIRDLQIPHLASAAKRVTLSLGVATKIPSGAATASELLAAADAALYLAKNQGRDRFAVTGL